MDEKQVSYIAFEGACARLERANTKLFIVVLVLIGALIASNAAWVVYEMQYTDVDVSKEVQQDAEGDGENTLEEAVAFRNQILGKW